MVEHKAHAFARRRKTSGATSKSGDQVIQGLVQRIGENRAFHVTPEAFDQVQARAIRLQPVDGDLIGAPAWRRGESPRCEDFLPRVPVPQRGQLLRRTRRITGQSLTERPLVMLTETCPSVPWSFRK